MVCVSPGPADVHFVWEKNGRELEMCVPTQTHALPDGRAHVLSWLRDAIRESAEYRCSVLSSAGNGTSKARVTVVRHGERPPPLPRSQLRRRACWCPGGRQEGGACGPCAASLPGTGGASAPASRLLLGASGTPVLRARVSLLCPQVPSPATWRPASRHVRMLCARPPRPAGGFPPGRPGGRWKPALPRGGVDTCFLRSTLLPVLFLDPFSEPLAACEAAHVRRARGPAFSGLLSFHGCLCFSDSRFLGFPLLSACESLRLGPC